MKKPLLYLLAMIFISCNTYKHQLQKAQAVFDGNPNAFAQRCALAFPVKDSVGKPDTIFVHEATNTDYSKTIDSLVGIVETIQEKAPVKVYDSNCIEEYDKLLRQQQALKERIADLQRKYKPCEPDTVLVEKPVYRTSTAALQSCQTELYKVRMTLDDAQKKIANKNKLLIGSWVLIVVLAALTLYKTKK